jgi:hypothetical protein
VIKIDIKIYLLVLLVLSTSVISVFLSSQLAFAKTNFKPTLDAAVKCMVASSIIPVYFNANGFPPNTKVGIAIDRNNVTSMDTNITNGSVPNFVLDLNKEAVTDGAGLLNGTFNIDSRAGPYEGYSLHVFVDANGDNKTDSKGLEASAPLICG